MLGESQKRTMKDDFPVVPPSAPSFFSQPLPTSSKRPRLDLPPVPGLEDES